MPQPLSDEVRAGLEKCLPYLHKIAGQIYTRTGGHWDDVLADVYAVAVELASHWRPNRGATVFTYIYPHIRRAYYGRKAWEASRTLPALSIDRLRQECQDGGHGPWEEPAANPPEGLDAADVRAVLAVAQESAGEDWQIMVDRANGDSIQACGDRLGISRDWARQKQLRATLRARAAVADRYPEMMEG